MSFRYSNPDLSLFLIMPYHLLLLIYLLALPFPSSKQMLICCLYVVWMMRHNWEFKRDFKSSKKIIKFILPNQNIAKDKFNIQLQSVYRYSENTYKSLQLAVAKTTLWLWSTMEIMRTFSWVGDQTRTSKLGLNSVSVPLQELLSHYLIFIYGKLAVGLIFQLHW